ncbi:MULTISPECIES: hypothetical protein [Streptomyces]|uniref:hypothetical protein n=1 Tax=Streptomyces TaxID=1883 RepID=UPI0029CCB640|nr:hypothetical protein [Streptomyces sp. F8]MDX6760504.1 hypothetical protein [Streptomyces sp. F8]
MTSRPSLEALRRLLRQERDDAWAVRMFRRIVLGIAGAYTLFTLASAGKGAFAMVCGLLFLAVTVWMLRRRGQLLLGLASTVVTAAMTGYLAAVGDIARGSASGLLSGQAVLGYWALGGMALLGAWMLKQPRGRRGVTVVLADVLLICASGVGMLAPLFGVPLGFMCVAGVLTLRSGTFRSVKRCERAAKGREVRRLLAAAETDGR